MPKSSKIVMIPREEIGFLCTSPVLVLLLLIIDIGLFKTYVIMTNDLAPILVRYVWGIGIPIIAIVLNAIMLVIGLDFFSMIKKILTT